MGMWLLLKSSLYFFLIFCDEFNVRAFCVRMSLREVSPNSQTENRKKKKRKDRKAKKCPAGRPAVDRRPETGDRKIF
jgi:hypothetical protein